MFLWFMQPDIWLTLITLTFLEIILGVDNIIFLSLVVAKLPLSQQNMARKLGLSCAMIMRILLLISIAWLSHITQPLFTVLTLEISFRTLILLGGGLFLIYKHLHHEYRLLNRSIKILVNATFPTDQYLALKPNNLMLLQKQSVMYVANCQPLTEYDKVSYHNYNPSRSDLILAGYFHWVLFLLPPGQSQNFYHHQDTTGYSYQHEHLIYNV